MGFGFPRECYPLFASPPKELKQFYLWIPPCLCPRPVMVNFYRFQWQQTAGCRVRAVGSPPLVWTELNHWLTRIQFPWLVLSHCVAPLGSVYHITAHHTDLCSGLHGTYFSGAFHMKVVAIYCCSLTVVRNKIAFLKIVWSLADICWAYPT